MIKLISFGYGHGPAPAATMTFDVREHFRDPVSVIDPPIRLLTGEDQEIAALVFTTPGVDMLIAAVEDAILAYLAGPADAPITVAIGCAGGRHRSVAIARELARRLGDSGADAWLTHRDIARPVLESGAR